MMSNSTDLFYYMHEGVNVKLLIEHGEHCDDFSFGVNDTEESMEYLDQARSGNVRANLVNLLKSILAHRRLIDGTWEIKKHAFSLRSPNIHCRLMFLMENHWYSFSVAMSAMYVPCIRNATTLTEKLNVVFGKGEFHDEFYCFPKIFRLQEVMRNDEALIAPQPVKSSKPKPNLKRARRDEFVEVDGAKRVNTTYIQ